jgi:hypothetical protein
MIFAVIKNNVVVSFLFDEKQKDFLLEQDSSIRFSPLPVEWDSENPILLSDCAVKEDGTVQLNSIEG